MRDRLIHIYKLLKGYDGLMHSCAFSRSENMQYIEDLDGKVSYVNEDRR